MSWGTKQGSAYDMVYGGGVYGNTPKPVSEMELGEVVNWGKDVLIPATKGKIRDNQGNIVADKGTSAVGAYQFTQGTLQDIAPKVLGEGWQQQKFSPEVQEGLAKYLYEQSKGGNLRGRWQGVKNEQVGHYANVPWEQARLEILQAESKLPNSSAPKAVQVAAVKATEPTIDTSGYEKGLARLEADRTQQLADISNGRVGLAEAWAARSKEEAEEPMFVMPQVVIPKLSMPVQVAASKQPKGSNRLNFSV